MLGLGEFNDFQVNAMFSSGLLGLWSGIALVDKGDFNGRQALLAAKAAKITRRLRTLLVGEREYVTMYGGEAVYADGSIVGRLRSCAYGFSVGRNIAYSYLPIHLGPGARVEVDVFGQRVPAEVSSDAVLKREHVAGHEAKPVPS